jgi:glutaredoxin
MSHITVYTKPACVQCNATFRALDNAGIRYTAVDITEDTDAREYVLSLATCRLPSSSPPIPTGQAFAPTGSKPSRPRDPISPEETNRHDSAQPAHRQPAGTLRRTRGRWASPASKNLTIWIVPHENISTILTPWFSPICSSWPGAANPRRDARE